MSGAEDEMVGEVALDGPHLSARRVMERRRGKEERGGAVVWEMERKVRNIPPRPSSRPLCR